MMCFDDMTQLDLTGPLEVFSRFPDSRVHLLSKSKSPVRSRGGLQIIPDTTFDKCPEKLTIFFVPGGPGIAHLLQDRDTMSFVASRKRDDYITSVCTGSLILAAAGLLTGYKATTHWMSMELLQLMGVLTVNERVVVDGNRITGAGVTSGIDFGLLLASVLFGRDLAEEIQLQIEYNPKPPFSSGHPDIADPRIVSSVRQKNIDAQERRRVMIDIFLAKKRFDSPG